MARTHGTKEAIERVTGRLDKLQRSVDKLARAQQLQHGVELVTLDYAPVEILLQATGRHERKRANAVRKEPWTVTWIESLPRGAVLWDVGANVGAYSLIAAKRTQGALRVVSVEPSFSTYASLCSNVVLNAVGTDVTPLPVMLGASTGMGVLGYADVAPGASFHAGGAASLKEDFVSVFDQPVLTFALDDLVDRFDLPAPDHLKLDVDGAEVAALEGARRALQRVGSAMVEISNRERAAVDPLMEAAGLVASAPEQRRDGDVGAPESVGYVEYRRD